MEYILPIIGLVGLIALLCWGLGQNEGEGEIK